MLRLLLAVLVVTALTACNDRPEYRFPQPSQAEVDATIARDAAIDDAQCKASGIQPGTNDYVLCRHQLEERRFTRAMFMMNSAMPQPQPGVTCYPFANAVRCN